MSNRTINQIDNRIARLQALMRRLRAERRVAILREQHRHIKFPCTEGVSQKGAYL
jgi:hypothetical protein